MKGSTPTPGRRLGVTRVSASGTDIAESISPTAAWLCDLRGKDDSRDTLAPRLRRRAHATVLAARAEPCVRPASASSDLLYSNRTQAGRRFKRDCAPR